jgi:hypothetical protein
MDSLGIGPIFTSPGFPIASLITKTGRAFISMLCPAINPSFDLASSAREMGFAVPFHKYRQAK